MIANSSDTNLKNIEIVGKLWNKLWEDYSARVSYAGIYQQMILQAGGTVANDHIAFRSLRLNVETPEGKKNLGIEYIGQIAEALGYFVAGELSFPDQKLYARHYRHPQQEQFDLPKLFISELIVEEMPADIAELIYQTVTTDLAIEIQSIASLMNTAETENIANQLQKIFTRPWQRPLHSTVETVNKITQYGAWVLLHGYAVNHFTGYINRHNTQQYPNIETTARGLTERGVPMKAEIEGNRSTGLRQTATQAITENVPVRDDISREIIYIPWTYAYYEIAERNLIEIAPGQTALFEAFLGPNAQNLFEMTRIADEGVEQ
ncbi:DUF1338 domain-containing protein [Microcoleus sp. FACHB-672]|uniref:DUF1338 domain-containing protein n=1 Tax=Microcoleus sp. FACHB-672 TaxID=2692825 RepID=UPI00168726D6|nr:DUF1338 domain-containing protein [Microcoleus sp. FACHB-672]MBD2041611.1 DUF1338 domain-containing protein [Microcoleus sp. FACHB-672]